ncbi:50S ribosomal protein L25 [bacterium]|nr:50S ribosomal protein L25 [bacterium]
MKFSVKSEQRDKLGTNAARRLRKEGKVPANLYGPNRKSTPLTLKKKDIIQILKSESGENTIFKVSFDSTTQNVMIKEVQIDPLTDELIHVDLVQIAMNKLVQVSVPVELSGEAVGEKSEGGFVDFVSRELNIECLPQNIPEQIGVDVSDLHINQSIRLEDLTPPQGVKFIDDPQTVIVNVGMPTEEEEVEEIPEEEVISEEEEPEVISKEEEEEETEEESSEEKE